MSFYSVKHLRDGQVYTRPSILVNEYAIHTRVHKPVVDPEVEAFHKQLPDYAETKLHSLPTIAKQLGFGHVFLKDESTRFGLPSFKVLGASWAIHRAICKRLNLPRTTSLAHLIAALQNGNHDIRLVTCTDGNWGRAVARTAKILGISALVYVPSFTSSYTIDLVRSESATVKVVTDGPGKGSYDDAVQAMQVDARESGSLMVMDTSWGGYEEIPAWVTEGYSTLLSETDRQVADLTQGGKADIAIGSVGVGSWMHAVTAHYAAGSRPAKVVTVEPDTAACLKESLHMGELTSIETEESIMAGMNCGTPSKIAWPVLQNGVRIAATVTDLESHQAVEELRKLSVNAGPCGAATLVALRKICEEGVPGLAGYDRKGKGVVLFSTEGWREYDIPK
ncbi:tryptophan synthase beta subunit-like PLP-dependent enzyme [Teratosphaeria nubilosa]|uniref:Tryptophan synthase beta subunit-like PLP-dependent enzyme n=1 Tax=Teratosphaeria nubilosa TaxID=161662 RepID=A0A6G1LL24_9PEZI|nr:tryptophan synthase beta subunit-like PLP-dependent enzyme [Teratosphaeria nubilosa]